MNTPLNLHNAKLSLFQSALNKTIQKKRLSATRLSEDQPMMQQANTVLKAANQGQDLNQFLGTSLECASLAVQAALAFAAGDQAKEALLRAQLQDSPCDVLGWTSALLTFEAYYGGGQAPKYTNWTQLSDFVYPIPESGRNGNQLTIGLLADWGTGDPAVAHTSLEALFACKPDVIIHLGDIYYAGTPDECTGNFLNYLVTACKAHYQVPVYNLAGNHDYYSGGPGYYTLLTQLNPECAPPGTATQGASFFCLRNAKWQIQAMDTGYGDHDIFTVANDTTQLQPSEVQWHMDKIASADGRRIILLSHHQLYSAFEKIGTAANNYYNPSLLANFETAMNSGAITAWFWGHEHVLGLYADFPLLNSNQPKGRCIGYSAFPMMKADNPYNLLVGSDKVPLLSDPPFLLTTQDVYNHGFVILTLADTYAQADYYQIPGDGAPAASPLYPKYSENLWDAGAAAVQTSSTPV
ncbi:MAG TPA: metallophosphoesterase [Bryobacteraceae bacterium]|jgi:predicted phosphodiesterase